MVISGDGIRPLGSYGRGNREKLNRVRRPGINMELCGGPLMQDNMPAISLWMSSSEAVGEAHRSKHKLTKREDFGIPILCC